MNYVPFLKYKVNEVGAIRALGDGEKKRVTPFFDLPRLDELSEGDLVGIIDKAYRKYEINLKEIPYFYLDNYDIDDRVKIGGRDNYEYLLQKFSNSTMVPVVGIDREPSRISAVVEAKRNGIISTDSVAIRVVSDDFESYQVIKDEIEALYDTLKGLFTEFHLVMDNRVCLGVDSEERAARIVGFVSEVSGLIEFERIIVAGSSIPASIRVLLEPNSTETIDRAEVLVFLGVYEKLPEVDIGDYTTVSPLYSDLKFPGEIIRRVTAPKLVYSFDSSMYFIRGGAIEGHPRGNKQYDDLAAILIAEPFFRKAPYSFGDNYLVNRAGGVGKNATPSTIPKCLINAHMTFMLNDFI